MASQGWFETVLARHLKNISADKLIVSIGSYGYDWENGKPAQEISVQEAWELLEESRARLSFDNESLNPTFSYLDDSSQDAAPGLVSRCGDRLRSDRRGIAGAAQGLGIVAARHRGSKHLVGAWPRPLGGCGSARNAIKTLHAGYDVLYKGKGEVLSASGVLQEGSRQITA